MPKGIQKKWHIIANEYVVSLFPIFLMLESFTRGFKKTVGQTVGEIAIKLVNHSSTYLVVPALWQKAHLHFKEKVQNNPDVLVKVFQNIKTTTRNLLAFTSKLKARELALASNAQLYQLYHRFCQLNRQVYDYGLIIGLLDFSDTTFLSDAVRNKLQQLLPANKVSQYFTLLTTPSQASYDRKQEINLLKILKAIQHYPKLMALIKTGEPAALVNKLSKISPVIFQKLRAHQQKYCWLIYVYEGPAADLVYYLLYLKDFLKQNINPLEQINKRKQELAGLKRQQKEYLNSLKLNSYHKKIFQLAPQAGWYKIYRRARQSQSYWQLEPLLSEIAKRLKITVKQLRMMLPAEVQRGLIDCRVNISQINQRLSLCVYHASDGRPAKLLAGRQAQKFCRNIAQPKIDKSLKQLSGSTAFVGKASGRAVIVNTPDDMKKMSKGDVLISFATNPNLMPAILKASAIVTDEGGLTCHAAIVSREFKIPCVVGTKIATKIFKDGDRVEVDANKGVVRKLNN